MTLREVFSIWSVRTPSLFLVLNFVRKPVALIRIISQTYPFFIEVERVTKKMSEDKKEYDMKMQEYAQLLDIRADRIRVSNSTNHFLIIL